MSILGLGSVYSIVSAFGGLDIYDMPLFKQTWPGQPAQKWKSASGGRSKVKLQTRAAKKRKKRRANGKRV